jgi:tetratricopeptide (TPR) repeat protein
MLSSKVARIVVAGLAAVLAVAGVRAAADERGGVVPAEVTALEQVLVSTPDSLEAGSNYRQAIVSAGLYDRALDLFERLVKEHPEAANAHLNYGFAYVDKIPAAGSITQVILANDALKEFSRSLELNGTWLAYYTRGNSYLFWPAVFGRLPLGIADLERALAIQKTEPLRSYHVRVFVSLGDGYWKTNRVNDARAIWTEGARLFPDNQALLSRLSKDGDGGLKAIIDEAFDPTRRVNTDLSEMWVGQ